MLSTSNKIFMPHQKTAVILFQLGGPDSLEAVEPFLYNLFMDPDIINFPFAFLFRRPLAKLISNRRAKKVRNNYTLIGGKSPLLDLTRQQARALGERLHHKGIQARVFIAMRYWHPMTNEVVKELQSDGFQQVILLPLYPQFSQATTGSSINEWNRQAKKQGLDIPTRTVCCYPNHPAFLDALVENINKSLEKFSGVSPESLDLVFSAHGVPVNYIQQGDPYQLQMEETVRRVLERGQWQSPHILCYQSKVGPMQWLKPSLLETVERLARNGRKHLLVIPIAFVTDHIETLHEINIEVRHQAMTHGVQQFELMPALNDHPKYIECLADLVSRQFTREEECKTCEQLWRQDRERIKPKKCPHGLSKEL
ncbi:MAG: ferrochelatase [Ignavibacteriae bacterium]|nr:MAG: ferrochelatase [Ignavibacteriota bacterium]